jgi:NitT/TauT family transport system permease protein
MYPKLPLTVNHLLLSLFVLVGILITWELSVILFSLPSYILPKPSEVISFIYEKWSILLFHTFVTFSEALLGFMIAAVFSFSIAILFYFFPSIQNILYPYLIGLKTTPLIAIIPFLIVWFGYEILSKAMAAALICFFPIVVNAIEGFSITNPDLNNLLRNYHASKWKKLRFVYIPMSVPFILSGLRTASTLSIIGAIVAEFLGANKGIGFFILTSSYYVDTIAMFSGLLMAMSIGLLFWYSLLLFEKCVKKKLNF